MHRNVEIKARARDWERQLERARIRGDHEEVLHQEDTFFRCPQDGSGEAPIRLKLRSVNGRSELIAYRRADAAGAKTSSYQICPVEDQAAMKVTLQAALGTIGVVRKNRTLVMIGQTRVHFDEVDGLGRFLELEVVLRDDQSDGEGQAIAQELREWLGIQDDDLIEGAYLDLITDR